MALIAEALGTSIRAVRATWSCDRSRSWPSTEKVGPEATACLFTKTGRSRWSKPSPGKSSRPPLTSPYRSIVTRQPPIALVFPGLTVDEQLANRGIGGRW